MANSNWGRWRLNADADLLIIEMTKAFNYEIELNDIKSSAGILDMIFQLNDKTWASDSDIRDLVNAMVDIFGRGACSGGFDDDEALKDKLRRRQQAAAR